MVKHNPTEAQLISLSVRVSPETAGALRENATSHHRSLAGHLRALIEADVTAGPKLAIQDAA